jgi:uncharacterized delta-60 repeat protein
VKTQSRRGLRGWLGRRAAAIAIACCALAAPLAAQAAPALARVVPAPETSLQPNPAGVVAGRLDPAFGKNGRTAFGFPAENASTVGPTYELPFEFTPGHLEMAKAPDGKLVVASASKVVRLLEDGQVDHSFGRNGAIKVPKPHGGVFVLSAATVDSKGRILLAGLTRPFAPNTTPDPLTSSAIVIRFNPNGSLDKSFAKGGMLISDLGLGNPKTATGTFTGPSVGLRDIVVDEFDRPVLSGGYATALTKCAQTPESSGFVARLTESGALDPSFAEGGLRRVPDIATQGLLASTPAGYLALGSSEPKCEGPRGPGTILTGFDQNGNIDSGFGAFGFRVIGFASAPSLAIAPSGKILLLGQPKKRRFSKKVTKRVQTLGRLLPSGAPDPGFGRIGRIEYILPNAGYYTAVAVDQKERILLAGRSEKRVSNTRKNHLRRSTFLLSRLDSDGHFDRRFGLKGSVLTGFGGPSNSFATQVLIGAKGRVIVGGGITSPSLHSGSGFAIARYFGGS